MDTQQVSNKVKHNMVGLSRESKSKMSYYITCGPKFKSKKDQVVAEKRKCHFHDIVMYLRLDGGATLSTSGENRSHYFLFFFKFLCYSKVKRTKRRGKGDRVVLQFMQPPKWQQHLRQKFSKVYERASLFESYLFDMHAKQKYN